jgi:hypothetical protein
VPVFALILLDLKNGLCLLFRSQRGKKMIRSRDHFFDRAMGPRSDRLKRENQNQNNKTF